MSTPTPWNAFFRPKGTPDRYRAKAQPCDGGGDEDACGAREAGKRRASICFRWTASHWNKEPNSWRARFAESAAAGSKARRHQRLAGAVKAVHSGPMVLKAMRKHRPETRGVAALHEGLADKMGR